MNQILQLDVSGMPRQWLSRENAALLYAKNRVCWELGDARMVLRGGINRQGIRSTMTVAPLVAIEQAQGKTRPQRTPLLSNPVLFRRDDHLCLYCGRHYPASQLTRDHVIPRVQGGRDCWTNVVTACQRCNHFKGGRTPEQAGMALLAVPFEPNIFEFLYLANHRIIADQMEYLSARFSGQRIWQAA